jgi:hypothetical protein
LIHIYRVLSAGTAATTESISLEIVGISSGDFSPSGAQEFVVGADSNSPAF